MIQLNIKNHLWQLVVLLMVLLSMTGLSSCSKDDGDDYTTEESEDQQVTNDRVMHYLQISGGTIDEETEEMKIYEKQIPPDKKEKERIKWKATFITGQEHFDMFPTEGVGTGTIRIWRTDGTVPARFGKILIVWSSGYPWDESGSFSPGFQVGHDRLYMPKR